jgi:hypothetical protein
MAQATHVNNKYHTWANHGDNQSIANNGRPIDAVDQPKALILFPKVFWHP